MSRRLFLLPILLALAGAARAADTNAPQPQRFPVISPDYTRVLLPPNIAPPNFMIKEPGRAYLATLRSANGPAIEISSRTPGIVIPEDKWKNLLARNKEQRLYIEISVQDPGGQWRFFDRITNAISSVPIDSHLVYRLMKPVYNYFHHLGIYQRNLENYDQTEVLDSDRINRGCLNCHTFLNNSPDNMALHTRTSAGKPMILVRTNEAVQVARTSGYLSWHPSGRMLAYSVNHVTQFFHSSGMEPHEVYDIVSDVGAIQLDTLQDLMPPQLGQTNLMETWPAWSPDGKWLYFCRGPRLPEAQYRSIQYDLMRVSYDIDKNVWGEPETVVPASATGLSCAQPRVSPDGKWVVFCMFERGHFPAFQQSSDLYIMDVETKKVRCIDEINSDQSESWHCWSHDGRWMTFASRRRDGMLALPYFAAANASGRFSKPFLLPQKDPEFYDKNLNNYNLPELIIKPVTISPEALARAVLKPGKVLHLEKPAGPASDAPDHQDEQAVESRPYQSAR